jgi:hypothetical protein
MDTLRKLWRAWLRFGQFLGDILARIVLTLFYFTLFAPFGIGVTWFSDPLRTRHADSADPVAWLDREQEDPTGLDGARRQF